MTKNPIFRGAATALVTPLTESGIDYNQFGRLIDWQIAGGIEGVRHFGGTLGDQILDMNKNILAEMK